MGHFEKKNGLSISKKREEFIQFLLDVRVATKKQLAIGLYNLDIYHKDFEKDLKKKIGALSFRINELQKANLIVSFIPRFEKYQKNTERVYTLTSEGFDFVNKYVIGQKSTTGSGFGGDRGSFTYNLYRPGLKNFQHTLLQTDVQVAVKNLRALSGGNVDYRNNLYAAQPFEDVEAALGKPARKVFRPDGEIVLSVEEQFEYEDLTFIEKRKDYEKAKSTLGDLFMRQLRYLVEIDTGSERGEHLQKKANQYKSYFKYLKSIGEPLPDGILFVTSNKRNTVTGFNIRKEERFLSIYKTFKELAEASPGEKKLNIAYLEVRELQKFLGLMISPVFERQHIARKAFGFLGEELPANIHSNFEDDPEYNLDLTTLTLKGNRRTTHWLFINADGWQSNPWNRAVEQFTLLKRPETLGLQKVDIRVQIVFYYLNVYATIPITPDEIKRTPNIAALMDNIYFLDISKELHESWHDIYYNKLTSIQNTSLTNIN